MSYTNYKWEVVAHDVNSPYLRNWLWTHSFFKYPKLLGISRAVLGISSRNNQIEYLTDLSTWAKSHEELKTKILERYENFEELINKSVTWGATLNNWTEENIFNKELSKLSGQDLILLMKKFIDMQEDQYAYGTALPILDYMSFSFVEGGLNKFLKDRVSKEKFQDYFSIFTEPSQNSFAQDQEESLLKLAQKFWNNIEWQNDIRNEKPDEVMGKYPDFSSALLQHSQKYAWVYYVYMGPAFTEKEFYQFIIDYVNKGVEPQKKLTELKDRREKILLLKEKYINELKPDKLNEFILRIASKVVWAKPRRKDYQSKSYYHVERLCREIAKRLFISLEQVRSAPIEILEKALNGEVVQWKIANEIRAFHICLPNDDGSMVTLIGTEAEEFSKNWIKRDEVTQDLSEIKELKGSTACVGKAEGKVKIINLPEEMYKMEYGDILVSAATTPSIVPAMKKAAAIITDEGGLACHASIVSRELNIPCVVGLKFITKFVKDGDLVEVNANTGVVRKI